jgi:ABC-type transport system involved in multi-copper enzyme maturation permease subunit
MSYLHGMLAVFRFELRRSLTLSRMGAWTTLALFPPSIVLLMFVGYGPDIAGYGFALSMLIPAVVCMLGSLLWASPLVNSELEGKTWIYLAARPKGRSSVFLGKYLTAVTWTALSGLGALTLCVIVTGAQGMQIPLGRLWTVFAILILLACLCYGALFALIGVLFQRRAMVICVAYCVLVEFVIPNVLPANTVLTEFTVNFHLRNLMVDWMGWENEFVGFQPLNSSWFSAAPAWQHLLPLIIAPAILLVAGTKIVQKREYITAEES